MKKIITVLIFIFGITTNAQLKENNKWYNSEFGSPLTGEIKMENHILISKVLSAPANGDGNNWKDNDILILMVDEGAGNGFSMAFILNGEYLNISDYVAEIVDIEINFDMSIGSFLFGGKDIKESILFSRVKKGVIHIKEITETNEKFVNYMRNRKEEKVGFSFIPLNDIGTTTLAFTISTILYEP